MPRSKLPKFDPAAASNPQERWAWITGSEGRYAVSSLGAIHGKYRPRKIQLDRSGYARVLFKTNSGKLTFFYVHRLVAEAFVQRAEGATVVNHLNGIKSDCRAQNLEWTDPSGNCRHAIDNGLLKPRKGEDSHRSKLRTAQVIEIIEALRRGSRQVDLARKHSMSQAAIWDIKNGRTWAHLSAVKINEDVA